MLMFCQLNMLLKLEEAKQDGNPHPVCIGISMKDITRVKITAGPYQSMPRWTWLTISSKSAKSN